MIFKNFKEKYKSIGGIYKITANGLIYIGRTNCFYSRYLQHIKKFTNLTCNSKFKTLIGNGSNPENFIFEVIEEDGGLLLKVREEYYIKLFNSVENGLNIIHNDNEFFEMFRGITYRHKKKYTYTYEILCEYIYKKRTFKENVEIYLPHTLKFYTNKKLASLLKKRIEEKFNIKSVKMLNVFREESEMMSRELNDE